MTSLLVVEDNKATREFMIEILEHAGYTVRSAETGTAALATLDAEQPSLLILDMRLPDLSGADVLQQVRHRHGTAAPRILVMTAMRFDTQAIAELTADSFLPKPFSAEQLLTQVRSLMQVEMKV